MSPDLALELFGGLALFGAFVAFAVWDGFRTRRISRSREGKR